MTEENMVEKEITNQMLYELITDFKDDVIRRMDAFESRMDAFESRMDAFEKRMDLLEKRMDNLERRMDSLERRMDSLERKIDTLETRVGEIYIHRNELTVKFTRSWALASLFMAMFAATTVLGIANIIS